METLLNFLIGLAKVLIILSYMILGLYVVDQANTTTIDDMQHLDWLVCSIGTIFVGFSFYLLFIFSQIKKI